MTPTESNFYRERMQSVPNKNFRRRFGVCFWHKNHDKTKSPIEIQNFFYQIPNPSEILNVYWHSESLRT